MIVAVSRIPLPKTERYLCWVRVAKFGKLLSKLAEFIPINNLHRFVGTII